MSYSIKQAQDEINSMIKKEEFSINSVKLLEVAINELNKCGDSWDSVSERLDLVLSNYSLLNNDLKEKWPEDVYLAVVEMKHKIKCLKQINAKNGKIDGETAQWITTITQGFLGVVSMVFAILFALKIIPNIFGELGENGDALYYCIGTFVQQFVAFILAIIIGIVNRCRIKKKYNSVISFEELLATKYGENSIKTRFLFPTYARYTQKIGRGASGYQDCKFYSI